MISIINKYKKESGFTLIELVLIVAIFVIILSSAVSLSTTQVFESDLNAKALAVADLVEKARNNSATGFRGDVWSIKVLDSDALCTDSGDCILLFKGRSFSERDTGYDRFVQFDSNTGVYVNADQENEFYFDYKSAWLSTTTATYLEQQHIVLNSNFGGQKSIVVHPSGTVSTFTCGEDKVFDVEGNNYKTVKIGTQCWMAENLNTGTMLTDVSDTPSDDGIIEKWCYDDTVANCNNEGGLYDWNEMMVYITTNGAQGICPGGWHLPTGAVQYSASEFDTLEDNYDTSLDGYNLKIGGPSGFNMPLNGERRNTPSYNDQGNLASLWSSTVNYLDSSFVYYIDNSGAPNVLNSTGNDQDYGFGVRCLKDY